MKRVRLLIAGRVQGVWFRATAQELAHQLGLGGWIRNLRDGRVEAVFEGEEAAVIKVIEWCRIGPIRARVDEVIVTWEEFRGEFDEFKSMTRFNTY